MEKFEGDELGKPEIAEPEIAPETHRLYEGQSKDFLNKEGKLKRKEFKKSGSETILLGDRLAGKAIVRIIKEEPFLAWKKAFEAVDYWRRKGFDYIPIEPILSRNGKLRASKMKDGKYRVVCRVLGENLSEFLSDQNQKNLELFQDDLRKQWSKITSGLDDLGINHGHPHWANMCVEMKNGKPRLYAIDFDQAYVFTDDDLNEEVERS